MNLEYCFSTSDVRKIDVDLSVKSTWSEQRWIEYVGTVGRRHNDNIVVGLESVHLNKQLIERLLSLVVTTTKTCTTLSADCVYFVYEYYARAVLFCRIKKASYTACAHAHVHFHKV